MDDLGVPLFLETPICVLVLTPLEKEHSSAQNLHLVVFHLFHGEKQKTMTSLKVGVDELNISNVMKKHVIESERFPQQP